MKSDHSASPRRMERLSHLRDYDIGRNEPDPRGWTVVNREGRAVGEVKDLVVDTQRMAATYLDVELDTKTLDLRDEDPHVLVPVERAHADGKRVVVDEISDSWAAELCAAREAHQREFWDRWWDRHEPSRESGMGARVTREVPRTELNRIVEDVRPGEAVRIPVVNEEIVVERRPVVGDERVLNHAAHDGRRERER
jgi:sporulation protein YlmC with PRC-barrel domain